MPTINLANLRLKVALGKAVPFWWRYAYLIPDVFKQHPEYLDGFVKVVQGKDTAFTQFVQTQVQKYVEKGVMPPAPIAAPIINIAEDVMAGREPLIRAGDYIAIQNQMRS